MSEATEQAALFEWAATFEERAPELKYLFHWPNGEYRTKAAAARLKAAGVKRGPVDCWLFVRQGDAPGMAFEMKSARGSLTPEQAALMTALKAQGWRTGVYKDWIDAAGAICRYLGYSYEYLGLAEALSDETRRAATRRAVVEGIDAAVLPGR